MNAPVLAAYPLEDGSPGLRVWCHWCDRWHLHGPEYGHYAAACWRRTSPYRRTGYILAEPPSLPEDIADAAERDILDALHVRYGAQHGNGPRYAVAEHVRTVGQPGSGIALRTADFIAMDLWASGGWELHGHEVKVSRSDWLRELKRPAKAAEFIPYMNRWWLVVSERDIVQDGELPDGWGLMTLTGHTLVTVVKAPHREALPLDGRRLAGLLRAVARTAAVAQALRRQVSAA